MIDMLVFRRICIIEIDYVKIFNIVTDRPFYQLMIAKVNKYFKKLTGSKKKILRLVIFIDHARNTRTLIILSDLHIFQILN